MKKIANFLVEKRFIVLAAMLFIAIACGILSQNVIINSDMTKYLPDTSSMKIGLDLMDKEFPAAEDAGDIRIMFDGLDGSQKTEVLKKLEAIKYVDNVDYKADSKDYNNGEHTLYIVNFKYDYSSKEAAAVENDISSGFKDYNMVYHVDKEATNLPTFIIVLAVALIMIILFLMCKSWLEPFLLLGTIGVAIIINMGTNVFFSSISETTGSIASILQLVLSMDYAMVLLNRYRQELELNGDSKTAMKSALANAFHAIVSSALATIVGLLALCFMSFKIGMDLSLVLAKGVLSSMLCIITIFPALLVIFDKGIKKTSKKVLPIKMDAIGRFSNKLRFVVTCAFVIIFVGAFLLSSNTKMAYVLAGQDPTEKYFPKNSQIVVLYDNSDEAAAAKLADQYANNPDVKDVKSFATTVGKAYTAEELAEKLGDTDSKSDINLDPSMLKIIYYDYFKGNTSGSLSASDFISFIANNIVTNETFADKLDSSMKDNIDTLKKFADPDNLTRQKTAAEIANFFGMKQEEVTQLFVYYYAEKGGVSTGTMTLARFADFIVNDIATNKEYASMLDKNTLSMINQLKVFTNKDTVTKPLTSAELASAMSMEEGTVKQLLVYYYAVQNSFNAGTMTVSRFVNFLTKDVASNKNFASYFDSASLSKMKMLAQYTNTALIQKQMTSPELSGALQMDASMVEQIFSMRFGGASGASMSMQEFVNFMLSSEQMTSHLDAATIGQLKFMQSIMNAATSGKAYNSKDMASMFGMKSGMVKILYTYNIAEHGNTSSWKISLQNTVNFIIKDLSSNSAFKSKFSGDRLNKLKMLKKLIDGTVTGKFYTSVGLSKLLGMDTKQLSQLYLLYDSKYGDTSGWKMSVQGFVNFILSDVLTNKSFSSEFNTDNASNLKTAKTMIDAVVSKKTYSAKELAALFGSLSDKLDEKSMDIMYLYYFSMNDNDPSWKLSINDLFKHLTNHIMKDPRFESFIQDDMRGDTSDMKTKLDDGVKQLVGPEYSRMVLSVSLQDGSDASGAFVGELSKKCKEAFGGKYYLIGNSPMVYEMSQSFEGEHKFISIITAIAIFIVVAVTFRSFLIPLILVLIIQGGVYLTISLTGLQGNSIYYLALLIVECILMGATIDYGILFASYYKESRASMGRCEALIAASNGSIHTILTSGLIMVLVTGIVGYAFNNPSVGQICMTISKGALCAVILIVFILPGVMATFDKLIYRANQKSKRVLVAEIAEET